ncbi:MAG: hypothetical protein ABJH06_06760 [Paraglaciecola sp.]|uniref:hypothetical protein n=1 Tax=Paraglaciecola sp. TaxID=1920173 RepID=UPI003298CD4C
MTTNTIQTNTSKWIKLTLACAIFMVFAACDGSKKQLLIGKWDCLGVMEDIQIKADVEYLKDGRSTAWFEMTVEEGNNEITFNGTLIGTWSLDAQTLTEETTKVNLVTVMAKGKRLPVEAFQSQLTSTMVGMPTTSQIEVLTEHRLVSYDPDSTTVSCTRKI